MKYCAENQLDIFDFCNSHFSLMSFDGNDLVISARCLCLQTTANLARSQHYLFIKQAQITLRGFCGISFGIDEDDRDSSLDVEWDGEWLSPLASTRIIFRGKESEEKALQKLREGFFVFDFVLKDEGHYSISSVTIEESPFTMDFCADSVLIEWDDYKEKAWYELHRQYQGGLTLSTPDGEQTIVARLICHDEDVYIEENPVKAPFVCVGIEYDGEEFWGYGKDLAGTEAIADLQEQLPEGVKIKSYHF